MPLFQWRLLHETFHVFASHKCVEFSPENEILTFLGTGVYKISFLCSILSKGKEVIRLL
jgi:hypothetical protein